MTRDAYQKLFWGFLLIMLDIRIQGLDILPDVIGYYFFYSGMVMLTAHSEHFRKGSNYAIIMMILSVFTLYEPPANSAGLIAPAGSVHPVYFLLAIVGLVMGLLTAYHLFRGIQDMAARQSLPGIESEAGTRWTQLLLINVATALTMVLVFLPFLFIVAVLVLFIAVLIYTIKVMQFMQRCREYFSDIHPDEPEPDVQL